MPGCRATAPCSWGASLLLLVVAHRIGSLPRLRNPLPPRSPQDYSYDLRGLCNTQDYTGVDDKGHAYSMNICGTTTAKCLPSECVLAATRGHSPAPPRLAFVVSLTTYDTPP